MGTKDVHGFVLIKEQAKELCEIYGIDYETAEDWEIIELIDKAIDDCIARKSEIMS